MTPKESTVANILLRWYAENRRDLPWRKGRDPYRVWISEVMLQQTTVRAVIPYYERFMERFPTVAALAAAPEEQVLNSWAGLGYYSRARNLHRAAKALAELKGFPKTHMELAKLPGFGEYTSRAVSSIAFGEPVGAVDGNLIRVISRLYDGAWLWWKPSERAEIQKIADALAESGDSGGVNQALMDLGSQICTPRSPLCAACPLLNICLARKNRTVADRPAARPRRKRELWLLTLTIHRKCNRILVRANESAPFLRGLLLPPLRAKQVPTRPKTFDFRHSITHHDIYVQLREIKCGEGGGRWMAPEQLARENPTSLLRKALDRLAPNTLGNGRGGARRLRGKSKEG